MHTYKLSKDNTTLFIPAFNDHEAKLIAKRLRMPSIHRFAGRFRVAGKLVTKYKRVL